MGCVEEEGRAQRGIGDSFGEASEVLLCAFAKPSSGLCKSWVLKHMLFRSNVSVPCATEGLNLGPVCLFAFLVRRDGAWQFACHVVSCSV